MMIDTKTPMPNGSVKPVTTTLTKRPALAAAGFTIRDAVESYGRHLSGPTSGRRAPATVGTYLSHLTRLATFLQERGMPTDVGLIGREHIEAYFQHLSTAVLNRKGELGVRPATLSVIFRSIAPFWRWLIEEGEIKESPMVRMTRPRVPEDLKKPILAADVAALQATCRTGSFEDTRDAAIMAVLFDTGVRRGELVGLRAEDLDLRSRTLLILAESSKGKRARLVPFGHDTARLLDRYLRRRSRHPNADLPALWLQSRRGHGWQRSPRKSDPKAPAGGLTGNGALQMIRRRAKAAGLDGVYTHAFRGGFAHAWLAAGGGEADAMRIAGWTDPKMIRNVYGARLAEERARTAHDTFSPMDALRRGR